MTIPEEEEEEKGAGVTVAVAAAVAETVSPRERAGTVAAKAATRRNEDKVHSKGSSSSRLPQRPALVNRLRRNVRSATSG